MCCLCYILLLQNELPLGDNKDSLTLARCDFFFFVFSRPQRVGEGGFSCSVVFVCSVCLIKKKKIKAASSDGRALAPLHASRLLLATVHLRGTQTLQIVNN